jgi:hypothetical protein
MGVREVQPQERRIALAEEASKSDPDLELARNPRKVG